MSATIRELADQLLVAEQQLTAERTAREVAEAEVARLREGVAYWAALLADTNRPAIAAKLRGVLGGVGGGNG